MQIKISTKHGETLIKQIFTHVKNEAPTWGIVKNNEGKEFVTHTPEQWNEKLLLGFAYTDSAVVVSMNWWTKNGEPDDATKGYYLGRFTEILLVHFKSRFTSLVIE